MEQELKRKVKYFIRSPYRDRADVRKALFLLSEYGRLAIVGGMLRDVALFGNAGFKSDVDLVVDTNNLSSFDNQMCRMGAKLNRFGGYSLPSQKWQIDVWPLERTWAHRYGHIEVKSISDLKRATFFTCDAIIFDLTSGKIEAASGYFDGLKNKTLEINLRPNPNPRGNAVRAFRYGLIKGFRWSPTLAKFVAEILDRYGWESLIHDEAQSFNSQYIESLKINEFQKALHLYVESAGDDLFDPSAFMNVQLRLPNV